MLRVEGDELGYSENRADLRLVLHRHVRHQHPGPAPLHRWARHELDRHALHPWGRSPTRACKLGAIFEFGVIATNIATAVVIYPLVKRQSATVGLGYVTARIMESVFIAIGLISIISVVDVNDALAGASGAEATALAVQGNTLVSIYEWAFLFGPGLVVGFGNGLMLGYLMYRSGLVPRTHGDAGSHRWPAADPLVRADPVRRLRERVRTFGPAGTAGDRLGGVARRSTRAWKGFRPSPIAEPR